MKNVKVHTFVMVRALDLISKLGARSKYQLSSEPLQISVAGSIGAIKRFCFPPHDGAATCTLNETFKLALKNIEDLKISLSSCTKKSEKVPLLPFLRLNFKTLRKIWHGYASVCPCVLEILHDSLNTLHFILYCYQQSRSMS